VPFSIREFTPKRIRGTDVHRAVILWTNIIPWFVAVAGLIGGAFALSANMIAWTIIGQINRTGRTQHRKMYPESRLVLTMHICTVLVVLTFGVLVWLTISR